MMATAPERMREWAKVVERYASELNALAAAMRLRAEIVEKQSSPPKEETCVD